MSHSLQNLADQIRVAQDEALERRSHAPAEQRLARIHAELGRRSAAPRRVWTVTVAALVAAAAIVVWVVSRPAVPLSAMAGGKSVEVNGYLHAANAAQALSFSDGTRLTLAENAAVRVVSIDARGARVALERGELHAAVIHRPKARWVVAAGPYQVLVTGTKFDARYDPGSETLRVEMREGSVRVTGGCLTSPRTLANQEQGEFRCGSPKAVAPPPEQAKPVAPPLPTASAPPPAPKVKADWRALASDGRFKAALAAAEAEGFSSLCTQESSDGLVQLGNAARLAGNPARAAEAYLALRQRFAGSAAAARAAFQLGRLAFDGSGDYAAARRWFGAYLAEQPGGGFAQEALGRLMEAEQRQGDGEAARRSATRYLAQFPSGAHAALARTLVAE
ncbi:MAG: FecR domain-containing protein [Polyangiaceae bacterium]|nr:FecR domain-containing protein [Polyangiaceae bacterium]